MYKKARGFDGTEDFVNSCIDINDMFDMLVERLDVELGSERHPDMKTLKKAASAVRLHQIVTGYRAALFARDMKQVEYWGAKIEEFCVSRPSNMPESVGKGMDMLMEVVARQLGKERRGEITEGSE